MDQRPSPGPRPQDQHTDAGRDLTLFLGEVADELYVRLHLVRV